MREQFAKAAKVVQRITAWSFSRFKDWRDCPRLAFYKHVDKKFKEPGSDAMAEGNYADHIAEVYATKALGKPLPRELAAFAKRYADELKVMRTGKLPATLRNFPQSFTELRKRSSSLHVQEQLCFDRQWKLLTDPRAWFDTRGGTWLRIKMDCWYDEGVRRKIIDYKNGKRVRDEHIEQLDLYAIAGFLTAPPSITEVELELWYLQIPDIKPDVPLIYTREDLPDLIKKWELNAKPMLADTKFPAVPGDACRFCYFGQSGKAKGGPGLCQY